MENTGIIFFYLVSFSSTLKALTDYGTVTYSKTAWKQNPLTENIPSGALFPP